MLTVDTSAWIEWIVDGPSAKHIGAILPKREERIVPTIVQLELAKWLVRERSEDAANSVLAYTQKCAIVPLDTNISLLAAQLSINHKLAVADAIVYATARVRDSDLVTCDSHFTGVDHVIFIPKSG